MAVTYSEKGDLEAAIKHYKNTIELLPTHVDAIFNLANSLRDQGQSQAALSLYKKVIATDPTDTDAFINMASIYKDMGNNNLAELQYRHALTIDSKNADLYYNLGNIKKEGMQFKEAQSYYKKALELRPSCQLTLNNMGNSYLELDELKEAANCFQKSLIINPNNPQTYVNLGNVLQSMRLFDDAIKSYEKASGLDPGNPSPILNLATTLHLIGRIDLAINSYLKALNLAPASKSIWNNIFFSLSTISSDYSNKSINQMFAKIDLAPSSSSSEFAVLKYRLSRGTKFSKNYLDDAIQSLAKFQLGTTVQNSKQIKKESEPKQELFSYIIAMIHFGRSGTGLLHSLLDNHSQLSSLPSIYFSEFFDNQIWETISDGGWNELVERFINTYPILFNAITSVPVQTQSGKFISDLGRKEGMTNVGTTGTEALNINVEHFRHELKKLLRHYNTVNQLTFFKLIHLAYENVLSRQTLPKHIFYHIHNPSAFAKLNFMTASPTTKWLIMVREPLQSFESWALETFKNQNYQGTVTRLLGLLFQIDDAMFQRQETVGVRLEDLKNHPEKTLASLCKWIGIKVEPSLYEMTAQGKKWWGDPSSPNFKVDGMTAFGKASINRKIGTVLSKHDQFILKTLFYPFNVRFGYEPKNLSQFKKNLLEIQPMIKQPFDFENDMNKLTNHNSDRLKQSGPFKYLRTHLQRRWNTLNELHTYPNMLQKLDVDIGEPQ